MAIRYLIFVFLEIHVSFQLLLYDYLCILVLLCLKTVKIRACRSYLDMHIMYTKPGIYV